MPPPADSGDINLMAGDIKVLNAPRWGELLLLMPPPTEITDGSTHLKVVKSCRCLRCRR